MATAAQITGDIYWQREIVTVELDYLGDEMCRRTGRPRDAAGTKGNTAHLRGAHRSQEWILKSLYCTSRTYTVQSGLTDIQARHVAGFDFTPGAVTAMIAQSKRLIAAMRAGLLDEVLAIYCNVDGDQVVDGWDNVENRAASSDTSHLWHWHLTLDRTQLTNLALMKRIIAYALGDLMPLTEDDITGLRYQNPRVEALLENYEAVRFGPPKGEKNQLRAQLDRIELAVKNASSVNIDALATAIVSKLPATSLTKGDVVAAFVEVLRDGVGSAPINPTLE